MTRFEYIKAMTIDEMAEDLCDQISEHEQLGCGFCPAYNKCYKGHYGMKDYLEEEIDESECSD